MTGRSRSGYKQQMPETLLLYLAYGSNLHPARLQARIRSAHLHGTTVLPGWQLAFHKRGADGSAKCNIVYRNTLAATVFGAVFRLSRQDKLVLDEIEGLGHGYLEQTIQLPEYGRVFTYKADSNYIDETLKPYDWYWRLVLQGARYHGFAENYVGLIETVETVRDPDPVRRRDNLKILADRPEPFLA